MSLPSHVPDVLSTSGSYRTVAELGRGGMGTVFLALAEGAAGFERKVAVKRMHSHLVKSPQAIERFLNEARLASHVHHANVVGIQQVGSDGENFFLVMDYVDGDGLDLLMRRAGDQGDKPPVRVVLRIVVDALAGLGAVHDACDDSGASLGILHRDVSPQNVLVGRDGTTRLADFGLAKCRGSRIVTDAAYVVGKLLYSAPEYLRHEEVGRGLDVYAMGVTLWSALAGQEPLPDCTEAQLLHQIFTDGIPPLDTDGGRIAGELVDIVAKACAPNVEDRYRSAAEMIDAIECLGRRSEWIASQAEVAAFVEEVAGPLLSMRRQKLASEFERAKKRADPARTVTFRTSVDSVKSALDGGAAKNRPGEAQKPPSSRKPRSTREPASARRAAIGEVSTVPESERSSWTRQPSVTRLPPKPLSLAATVLLMAVTGAGLFLNRSPSPSLPAAVGTATAGHATLAASAPFEVETPVAAAQPAPSVEAPLPAAPEAPTSTKTARAAGKAKGRIVPQSAALSDEISVVNPYRK